MKRRQLASIAIIVLCSTLLALGERLLSLSEVHCRQQEQQHNLGFCGEEEEEFADQLIRMATVGGLHDSTSPSSQQNNSEIDALARFAIQEHNKKENALFELVRVVEAREQVVAGTLHHLTLEVIDAGKKKLYEAKVWVKPWLNFKELQEFKHVEDIPSFTPSDLGIKKDGHGLGWQSVPAHDPIVQDAANHALATIQQRSNSLFAYELLEILHANAEVAEESARFDLHLKVRRGGREEKFKVEVNRNSEGYFHLNHMEPLQS
ncbi:cysteine proteinase inhibitor 6-like [Coffea arabica]|uniref:Cysteine proteinase inhibitor n=1 Tax=Coffea arabica TaxID=13443 RepID=A0A6P6VLS4_COFAR|nr:cysteine proteinase inhibitor 6-like [Coffea arabica]